MMSITKQERTAILKNVSSDWQHPYRPLVLTAQGWGKLDPAAMVATLENSIPDADHKARELVDLMQRHRWSMHAKDFVAGEQQAQRQTNRAPHITLSVAGKRYQLACKAYPQLHLTGVAA